MNSLQFGSYLFEHNPRKISLSYAAGIAEHLLPARGAVCQYLGRRCRTVRCEGEVFASTPEGAAEKLAALGALADAGAQTLYLPTGERFGAMVARFAYTAQGDGRVLSYLLEFLESASPGGNP